jgi:hypothetical protein
MSVHVDQVQTRVLPTPPADAPSSGGPARPDAMAAEMRTRLQIAHRDECRTAARDFDD